MSDTQRSAEPAVQRRRVPHWLYVLWLRALYWPLCTARIDRKSTRLNSSHP
jgi:hypothetical protein